MATKKKAGRISVPIRLDPREVERIDALMATVKESEAAREFGVKVDRGLVLRIAVSRGLQVMEAGAAAPRAASATAVEPKKAEIAPKKAKKAGTGQKKTENGKSDVLSGGDVAERDENGVFLAPKGWNEWSAGERIPEEHAEVHDYYVNNGWRRFWGKAGDESITFYWTGDERLHELEPFRADAGGKEVKIQTTPYGPGHLVPHGWAG